MKVIATIEADFCQGPLGAASRLNEELLGETIIRRTLKQVLAAKRVAGVHLVVESAQEQLAHEAASDLEVKVETHDAGAVPWRTYIASARKWALDSWRGGISDTTIFDESIHPWVLEALAKREQADGVAVIPPAAPLLDPALLDRMIEHYEKVYEGVRMAFTQSAPGLSAAIYMPSMLADFAKAAQPPGRAMAYYPTNPKRDMVMLPSFYADEPAVTRATGRCVADTDVAIERVTAILKEKANGHPDASTVPDAITVSQWLIDHQFDTGSLPVEVEIELTTEDALNESTLRPRGEAVGQRGPMDEGLFANLIDQLADRDDIRVVLGGFGDPLMHPQFADLLKRCREAGVLGIAVRTPAVTLDEEKIQALIENRVDVLNVLLDANTAETYRKLHKADHFDQVLANLERLFEAHHQVQQPQPIVVCEMTKTQDTMDELEAFYDHWIGKVGAAMLIGPSHYSGQWPNLAVMNMAPPTRWPCYRLFNRAMVLADGKITACDQDFRGLHPIGSLTENSLSELWAGPAMTAIRQSHLAGSYNGMPLCANCEEWHRP